MSDPDATTRIGEPRGRRRGVLGALIGVIAGVLAFLLIVLGVLVLGGNSEDLAEPDVAATPVTPPAADDEEAPGATPAPTPTPTPTPSPTPEEREPTDADAAAFASNYQPPGARDVESVTIDITGDGWPEIVVTSIANDVTRVDVAMWNGQSYEVVFTDQGGEAETIARFTVRDVTGDGVREIVTLQEFGQDGQSLSIWGWDGEAFTRQPAEGGCWDGSHTYGIIGARFDEGEIEASCDGAPLPTVAWPWDVYVWDGDAWTHERTEGDL